MNESVSRLFLLLWKNWTIQKRKPKRLACDILIPLFIGAFLLYVRYEAKIYEAPETSNYKPFGMNFLPGMNNFKGRWGGSRWNANDVWKLINSTDQRSAASLLDLLLESNGTYFKEQLPQLPKWKLVWSPNHGLVNEIMRKACDDMGVIGFSVENASILEKTMAVPSSDFPNPSKAILAGVVFPEEILENNDLPLNLSIKIRFPAELRFPRRSSVQMIPSNWLTGLIFPRIQLPGPRQPEENEGGAPGYYKEGFLRVQDAVSSAILNYHLKKKGEMPKFEIKLTRFPYSGYILDPIILIMQEFLPFLIVISYLFSVKTMTEKITAEKERRLKVVMNIMGLSDSLRWSSWFIYSMLFFSMLVTILILAFKVPFIHGRSVFPGSNWICLALFFLCYAAASTAFCFLVSTIFSRAGIASIIAGMAWFLLFVPYYVIHEKFAEISVLTKCISSLLLNTGMGIGMHIILVYEGAGSGLQWDNIIKPPTPDDGMTVAHSLTFIVLDCVLYMCMAFYIENVFPGEFGTPLPWYYLFQRSYWFPQKREVSDKYNASEEVDFPLEKEAKNLPAGIRIKNLQKVYEKNKKAAVQNLSLNAYEGQITILMGFNGAGKTTTLSILTGIYPPTSGSATVAGYDIVTNIKEVRKNLGFCPQYNVLFDELNVEEHIEFYGKLKGLDKKKIALETDKYINLLNLKDKSKTLSKNLSGGMKRKLSVALAMCGDMKVLIFDEPTAGMDPTARRSLWDLLISEKKGRSILITTHHLDEANLLGDRVAIMSEGKLKCCGSTFFLKRHYSCGYHLNIIKRDNCDVARVTELIQTFIPEHVDAEDLGMELSYRLPDHYSNKFKELFAALDNEKDELKIIGFGVTPTTLEDVIIRKRGKAMPHIYGTTGNVYRISNEAAVKAEQKTSTSNGSSEPIKVKISDVEMETGLSLLLNQIRAMFYKHIKWSFRTWKRYILLIVITICGISNAIFTIRLNNQMLNLQPRVLQLEDFPNGMATVKTGDSCTGSCMTFFTSYNKVLMRQNMNITRLTDRNMDHYLLEECNRNAYIYRNRHILGTTFNIMKSKNKETTEINGWFNALPYHTAPIALANVYDAIFDALVAPHSSLTFTNEPLPYSEETKVEIQGMGIDKGFQIAMFIAFTSVFVSSFFILFPIEEREAKAKLLQMVSGVGALTFWSVALLCDLIKAMGTNLALVATLAAFQEEGLNKPFELAYSGLILFSFFVANLPMLYLGSFIWSKPGLGFVMSSFFSIITGIFSMVLVLILKTPSLDLADIGEILDWVFTVFPLFSLGRSFQNLNKFSSRLEMCKEVYQESCLPKEDFIDMCCKVPEKCPLGICLDWTEMPLDWEEPGFGRYFLFFYIIGISCFILLLAIENGLLKIFKRRRTSPPYSDMESRDSDVVAERGKILNVPKKDRETYNLILDGVSKKFANYVAVNNLYLAVNKGECFGLLGANGAGKTTTFRMLTGDEFPSSGDAFIKGLCLRKEMRKIRQLIGYCPQFDALIDDLTGREHLRLYCLIRGVPSADVEVTSLKLARDLLFEEFLDKRVSEYSGGNKRKLSTAIALIGNPPTVFLDEPTAGIDPVAKRHLWAVINKLRAEGTTIILTSHSMEECEALCTRLTIMVKGEFKCLGTAQYLKNKYCQGYSLAIKVKKNNEEHDESEDFEVYTKGIETFICESFPGAVRMEKHEELLVYRIPNSGLTLSEIFGLVESEKERLRIEDYSLGQTTLEQIFLKIAGTQSDGD